MWFNATGAPGDSNVYTYDDIDANANLYAYFNANTNGDSNEHSNPECYRDGIRE